VADVSQAGLGITFIGDEEWPEILTLEYSLSQKPNEKKLVRCRTVWESSMVFYKVDMQVSVRRRGLEYVEPGIEAVGILQRHLESIDQ